MRLLPESARIVSGEVIFEDQDLLKLSEPEMRHVRGARIAMIFQEPMTSLNPVFTIGSQIGEAVRLHQHTNRAELQPIFDSANAVFVKCTRLFGAIRQTIVRFCFRLERSAFQKGNVLV